MSKFTVFVQESNGEGTIHIQTYEAENVEQACHLALEQVAADWGGAECGYSADDDSLHVLGVAKGEVEIIDWHDLNT